MIRKIVPELAAAMMGKSIQYIRIGLQRNLLPFGTAVPTSGTASRPRYSYYISPKKFVEYTGFSMEDIEETAARIGCRI